MTAPALGDRRIRQIVERANRTHTVHDAFRKQAAASAGRAALVCGERELSYLALDARSDAVARKLTERGIGRGSMVGLFAPRGPETLAAMLGILKAGGTCLPLDVGCPHKVLRYICEDASPALMLVQEDHIRIGRVPQFWGCPSQDIGPDALLEGRRTLQPMPMITGEDTAFLMYTFATSGQPRGVQIPHRAVLRLAREPDFVTLDTQQVVLQASPLGLDPALFEIWGALLNGGRLALVTALHASPDVVADTLSRHGVTTAWLGAGLFHHFVDQRPEALKTLRQLLVAGDVISPAHAERARASLPGCRIISIYGQTENAGVSCAYEIPADQPVTGPLPIGRPVAGSESLVLDDARRAIGDSREGELCVGGNGLANGYVNRTQLTAERFAHAIGKVQRLFRTGDRVRRRADGLFELVCRADRQVVVNGRRVDLDRIETCLRNSGMVADACVITLGDLHQRRIAAFVTPVLGGAVCTSGLRDHLRNVLPDSVMPSIVQAVDALPIAGNGRVDRAALAERVPAAPRVTPAHHPAAFVSSSASPVETQLLKIWREVLENDSITRTDNFFDIGGSSVQLMQVHALIQATLHVDVAVVDLFMYPRLNTLAAWISRSAKRQQRSAVEAPPKTWKDTLSFGLTRRFTATQGQIAQIAQDQWFTATRVEEPARDTSATLRAASRRASPAMAGRPEWGPALARGNPSG